MKYLLDTCTVSDFIKGEINTRKQIMDLNPKDLAVSTVTVMEIYYGLFKNPERAKSIQLVIEAFLEAIFVLPFEVRDSIKAGDIRTRLEQKGNPIGAYDLLIAAVGLNRDLVVVTSNIREFKEVHELKTMNWRK